MPCCRPAKHPVLFHSFQALLLAVGWSCMTSAATPNQDAAPSSAVTMLNPATGKGPGFVLVDSAKAGLFFTNRLDEFSGAANRTLYNGSGLALGDFDNDGLTDIYLCDLSGHNALFRNQGNFTFSNVTAQVGLANPIPHSRGAVFADINGDGWLDLLITATGKGVSCFTNSRGRFVDTTGTCGIVGNAGCTSLALADVDGNGTLDLYVVNYRSDDIRDRGKVEITMVNGRPVMRGSEPERFVMINGRLEECGEPDQLLLNDGAGHFKAVSWTEGAFLDESGQPLKQAPRDWGLTAAFQDVNGDGAPDLYVCNDYWTPDRLWINNGKGQFRALDNAALRKTSASSMSVAFSDINRDGYVDFFVVDMLSRFPELRKRQSMAQMLRFSPVGATDDRPQVMRNTLFLNRGDTSFSEIAYYAGVAASDWSWAPLFVDVDLDGYEDLLIGAGHFRDVQDYDAEAQVKARQHPWPPFPSEAERQKAYTTELMQNFRLYPLLKMPIAAFRNGGDCRFKEVTSSWGFADEGIHQGLALADLDGDGDKDLVVNALNDSVLLYRNDSTAPRVVVCLRGQSPNSQAIGAKVTLRNSALPLQTAEVVCGGHYQSGSDTTLTFAAGLAATNAVIEVQWRSGLRSFLSGVVSNRRYELSETNTAIVPPPAIAAPSTLFADASAALDHHHTENTFNDLERQPLLPFKLSQLGPGIAWVDLDNDGNDELVIGSGRGGRLVAYKTGPGTEFKQLELPQITAGADDISGLAAYAYDGTRGLFVGTAGYESPSNSPLRVLVATNASLSLSVTSPTLPANHLAIGAAPGGGLVLFASGGVSPGRYPLGRASSLFRLEPRGWRVDTRASAGLENLGIVNSAVWTDIDNDGISELALACEWGPVRVMKWRGDALVEVTQELGLSHYTGWWRSITAGDFNNDGRLDLVVGNWGLNSAFRASDAQPLTFLYGEMSQPGTMDVIETEYVRSGLAPTRQFMDMSSAMPFLSGVFHSHRQYSQATVDQLLGERRVLAKAVTAATLSSMLFLNTGAGFTAVPLPMEAQFAPVFGLNVADCDGDGNEDLFLAQNFFDVRPELTRIDAGLGLWLRGDGKGNFVPMAPRESGIRITGEQRGSAVCDFNADGRVDIAVTQNGAATRLFANQGARPGLRVRLQGPPENPLGIGAVLRLRSRGLGPAKEIHSGSGYWSMDSTTQVLATPDEPQQIGVRWPGGKETTTPLGPGMRNVVLNSKGELIKP